MAAVSGWPTSRLSMVAGLVIPCALLHVRCGASGYRADAAFSVWRSSCWLARHPPGRSSFFCQASGFCFLAVQKPRQVSEKSGCVVCHGRAFQESSLRCAAVTDRRPCRLVALKKGGQGEVDLGSLLVVVLGLAEPKVNDRFGSAYAPDARCAKAGCFGWWAPTYTAPVDL